LDRIGLESGTRRGRACEIDTFGRNRVRWCGRDEEGKKIKSKKNKNKNKPKKETGDIRMRRMGHGGKSSKGEGQGVLHAGRI
jgi:hypothetical protein